MRATLLRIGRSSFSSQGRSTRPSTCRAHPPRQAKAHTPSRRLRCRDARPPPPPPPPHRPPPLSLSLLARLPCRRPVLRSCCGDAASRRADKMAMGMRARESVNMSEDLTQAIAPYATALHDASLQSHCSSCFRGIPAQSPRDMSCTTCGSVRYCCSDCLISGCEVHSSSGECCLFVNHLREGSPSTLTEETSDIRAALRLLYSLETRGLVSSDSVSSYNRIGGLSASGIREVLEEGGEIAEGVLEGSLLMLSARKLRMKNSVGLSNGLTIEKVALWAVMTNSVEVQISEEQSLGIAVYGPSFSWFNHSCCPNASYRFVLVPQNEGCTSNKPESCVVPVSKGAAPDAWHAWQNEEAGFAHAQCKYGPRVVVRCTKPINKGDEVFITYIDLLQTRIVKDCYRIGLVKVQGLRCDARNLKSPHNAVTDPAIEDLDNNLQQAISEYSFLDDSKACCDVIESMLSENLMSDLQQEELSPRKYILHPLHHISVSSFMILASAYRCSAFKSSTDNLHGENCDFIFRMTKAAAAYSIVLAGATHHLFLSECSFVTLLSHFLLSTGQSILDFAECIKGETRKNIPEAIFSFASCSTNLAKHDSVRYNQFRSTCEKFGKHLLYLSLQCWPFLAQGLPCLEKIKNPIDFSWLGPAIFQAFQLSEEDSFNLSVKHAPATLIEQQKECILSLAVCCITYSKYLARSKSFLFVTLGRLEESSSDWAVKIFDLNNGAKVYSRIKEYYLHFAKCLLIPTSINFFQDPHTNMGKITSNMWTGEVVFRMADEYDRSSYRRSGADDEEGGYNKTNTGDYGRSGDDYGRDNGLFNKSSNDDNESGYKNTNTDEYGNTGNYKSNTDDLTGGFNKYSGSGGYNKSGADDYSGSGGYNKSGNNDYSGSGGGYNKSGGGDYGSEYKDSSTGDYARGDEYKKSSSDDYDGGYKKSSSNDDGYGGNGYNKSSTGDYDSGKNTSSTDEYGGSGYNKSSTDNSESGYNKSGTGEYGSGGGYNKSSTDNYESGYNKSGTGDYGSGGGYNKSDAGDYTGGYNKSSTDEYATGRGKTSSDDY
uniref:SET domain-containing protein n=1 Tax=Oryza glumipatula TaxID=40148 RepID=A0A0D9ZKT0_9ORYZ